MATTKIPNQAVEVYSPTDTLFNDRTSECQWHLDHHPLATCDDVTEIVLDTAVEEADVENDGDFDFEVSGNTDGVSAFRLADSGADFTASNVEVGMIARNEEDDTTAVITSVGTTTVVLDADIFTVQPKPYSITNYELDGNMNLGTSELIKTDGAAGTMTQPDILETDSLYSLSINITSFASSIDGAQINFKIGGTIVLTLDETDTVTGTHIIYGRAEGVAPNDIEITADDGIAATFTTLRVDLISNVVYWVHNCDDDAVVYTGLTTDVTNSGTTGQIKVSFDWGNLQDGYDCQGCYYITMVDDIGIPDNLNADRINDGDFLGAGWNYGTGWATTGTSASCNHVGVGCGELTQTVLAVTFSKSLSYDVVFTMLNYVTGSLDVKLFNGVTEVANLGNISADGTYTLSTGVLSSNCDSIKFVPNTSFSQDYDIDDVSAILDVADTGYDWRTNCFQLSDSHDCTVKLSGTNLDNAFGIDFVGLAYSPFVRVTGELEMPTYSGDKADEEDSAGVSKTLYFKSEKQRNLFIWQQPEYVHDFLRLLKGYDTFKIDGVDYVGIEAEYEVEAERQLGKIPDLGNANTTVRLKTDLNENKFC